MSVALPLEAAPPTRHGALMFRAGHVAYVVMFAWVLAVYAGGCSDRDTSCSADGDCAVGLTCQSGTCVGPRDGGTPEAATSLVCGQDGVACTADEACCSRRCTSLRCTPIISASDLDAEAPRCAALYELCLTANDCCVGLNCQNNACR